MYREFLTGAIASPQGPTHYNVMSRVFNKMNKEWLCISPQVSWCMLAATWDLHIWCNLNLNNVAPKCRVPSLQQLRTIPSIVDKYHIHWQYDSHCAKATLKTLIIILVINNHNRNPAMLAIWIIYPMIYKSIIPMAQSKYILATYSPKPGRFNKHRTISHHILATYRLKTKPV